MARPSKYTPELAERICQEIIEGKSLRSICKEDWCPAISNVCNWLATNKEFQEQYARAREAQAEILADEIIELADTCREGTKIKITDKGTETITGDMVERSKLQVDARKWTAARLLPKKYGEKLELAGDPERPLKLTIEHIGKRDSRPADQATA